MLHLNWFSMGFAEPAIRAYTIEVLVLDDNRLPDLLLLPLRLTLIVRWRIWYPHNLIEHVARLRGAETPTLSLVHYAILDGCLRLLYSPNELTVVVRLCLIVCSFIDSQAFGPVSPWALRLRLLLQKLLLDSLEVVPKGGVLREEVDASLVAHGDGLGWPEYLLAETLLELPLVSRLRSLNEVEVLLQVCHEHLLLTLYATLQITDKRCLPTNSHLHQMKLVNTRYLVIVAMMAMLGRGWFKLLW